MSWHWFTTTIGIQLAILRSLDSISTAPGIIRQVLTSTKLDYDGCATKEKVIQIILHLWLMIQHVLMTRLSNYSSFLTTVHLANSTQEQPVISCLKPSSNHSKSASTILPCCGGQLTMLSARINYLHSVSGMIISNVIFAHQFWVWYRAIQTDGPSFPLYYAWYTTTRLFHDEGERYTESI